MHEGYINATNRFGKLNYWRAHYAIASRFAGHYDVARTQLEALGWEVPAKYLADWGVDLSLLPLEVAARTSPVATAVAHAEDDAKRNASKALEDYRKLSANSTNADERTRRFIQCRIATLEIENRLQQGQWVDFLPEDGEDPAWEFARGQVTAMPGGGIEVRCGPGGHSIYCRARVGARFEVTGEFEVVGASGGSFQAGLVMGLPNPHDPACNAFEIKRDPTEGAGVSYSSSRNGGGRLLPATINVGNNTFNFRMAGTNATASVNGVPVLRNARVPSRIHSQGNQILAGLGAADGFSQTAIRYRNVKLRRLPGSKAAEQEE
jgi:hypothetical protein